MSLHRRLIIKDTCSVENFRYGLKRKFQMPLQEDEMKLLAIPAALVAGLGALVFMGTFAMTVPASAKCMIDEGNGRYTPCAALYMSKKCFVDEGNGRHTPCEALMKPKKAPKKG
jgi:hypothetical protein